MAVTEKMPGEVERQFVGPETVDGKTANKYRVVYIVADKKETSFQWIAADSGLPLKIAAGDGSWYLNIKT